MGSSRPKSLSKQSRKRAGVAKRKRVKKIWERAAPAKSSHRHLTPKKKAAAKAMAKRAGRPYPNLVDNVRAAAPKRTGPRR